MGYRGEIKDSVSQSEPQIHVADRLVVKMPDEGLVRKGFEKYDRVVQHELPPQFRPRFTRLGDSTIYRGRGV